MLAHTCGQLRTKLGVLNKAGHLPVSLATSAAARLQHADAYEACGEALQEFRDAVKDFAQRTVAPHAAEIDRLNSFPKSTNLWKEIGDFGLHGAQCRSMAMIATTSISHQTVGNRQLVDAGLTAPSDYGGLDVGYQHHCVAMEVGTFASVCCHQSCLCVLRLCNIKWSERM